MYDRISSYASEIRARKKNLMIYDSHKEAYRYLKHTELNFIFSRHGYSIVAYYCPKEGRQSRVLGRGNWERFYPHAWSFDRIKMHVLTEFNGYKFKFSERGIK